MSLFPQRPGGRLGYLPLFDDTALPDEKVKQEEVTPEERDSVLHDIGSAAGGTVSRVGEALSAPGDYTRGALAGRPGERVTGRELNRHLGLAGEEDNWWNFAGGLVTDLATDPLTYVTGPGASLTKAGAAAKQLGWLDAAASVATRKAIASGAARTGVGLPGVAKMTKKALDATGRTLSTFDPAVVGRPLYGHRTARRAVSLDDYITQAANPHKAEKAARKLLGAEFDTVRSQPLTKSFGIGSPFGTPEITGDLFGKQFGDKFADVLDTAGQKMRWSGPGRLAHAVFNGKVGTALGAEDQLTNIANHAARAQGRKAGVRSHVFHLAQLHEAGGDVFDEAAGLRMGRLIEGPAAMKAGDAAWLATRPAVAAYINKWKNLAPDVLAARKALGMAGTALKDDYGIEYLPRQAEQVLEMEGRRDKKLGAALSTMTGDQMGRTNAMSVPGGRDTIIELSRDAAVSGPNRVHTTDDAAATYLRTVLDPKLTAGQPALEHEKLVRLARVLHSLPAEVTTRSPLFGQHPTQMIGDYLKNNGEAMGTAGVLLDSLATHHKLGTPGSQVTGKSISMMQALERLGLRTTDKGRVGAGRQMRERIGKLTGDRPGAIDLSAVSIAEEHVERLARARDAFSVDEPSGALVQWLDYYTQAWKGSILAWPARATRDLYSGAVSNWLSGAFSNEATVAVKSLLTHGPEHPEFLRVLHTIPEYTGKDGLARFFSDLAGTELITGPTAFEAGAASTGKRALDPIIGAAPNRVGVGSIAAEFASQPGRSWKQFGKDFMTWRSKLHPLVETQNPLLRAGEKMNSLTDGINRLSGYIALLQKGYTADAAGEMMKRAHVDYTALSSIERNWLRFMFPWYSYQSRIFREVLSQLVERPGGRYGAMIKTTERAQDSSDDTYIPASMRASMAMALPDILGGKPSPGTQRYLSDVDFPGLDQINMVETPGTLSGAAAGTARQIAMQLHPGARTAAEIAFGTELFTGRPLGEGVSPLDAIGRSVTGNQAFDAPWLLDKAAELLPGAGRPLYTARSLLDQSGDADARSRAVKTAVNAFTGVKFRDVTREHALSDAARQLEQSIDPYTRDFKTTYIPEALLPQVPAWAQQRLRVARALQRENRQAKKKLAPTKGKGTHQHAASRSIFD